MSTEQLPEGLQHDDEQRAPVVTGSPDTIWLCYGDLDRDATHRECGEVMWCEDKQDQSDVRYVRADLSGADQAQRIALMDALLRSMQADAVEYLRPDGGRDAAWLVGRMLRHLDGQEQRAAEGDAS